VTNAEHGRRLLKGAEELSREMNSALQRESWNLTVRRAQEVVELTLKGLLGLMGTEYPKVHDVGSVFMNQVKRKGSLLPEETLTEIAKISAELARKRAPAFYF
jgi:HEPN domain-containing protein